MALEIWTKSSGYNFGAEPARNESVNSGNFVAGQRYIIVSVGTTDFKKIGADYNGVGIIFTATNNGAGAGPSIATLNNTTLDTPGSGVASKIAFPERRQLEIALPVNSTPGVTYSVISGSLPPGLRLDGSSIIGSPFEVPRITDFTFCIRAKSTAGISDRTFIITVEGEDVPEFITPEGLLSLGDPGELFVIDSTYVDYQIEAIDADTTTGQRLSYYIDRDGGSLPPGLVLTDDGRIVGFVQPTLAITPADGDGTYDNSYYDAVAFDFAFVPTNGYDSYVYDTVFFGFALQSNRPKKLNRTYEFTVTVTDGDSFNKRKFKIFVVGDDFFRADNTTWLDGNSMFTADVTYMRPPMWLTSSYLGLYRANNYITLILDTYDTENIIYNLEQINADCRATTRRIAEPDNVIGSYTITTTLTTVAPTVGHFLIFNGSQIVNRVDNVQDLGNGEYRLTVYYPLDINVEDDVEFLIGTLSTIPPGMQFDENNSEVHGLVPYQPAVTKTYKFTVTATRISDKGERSSTPKIFTVDLLGEVDSVLSWNTPSALGTINANFISTLSVSATSTVTGATLLYTVTSGTLPPGLTLDLDGEIVGKVNQYSINGVYKSFWKSNRLYVIDDIVLYDGTYYRALVQHTSNSSDIILDTTFPYTDDPYLDNSKWAVETATLGGGLTTFDFTGVNTTFDGGTSSIDRVYTFTVEARDQFGYSAISRTFTINIDTPNQLIYSNIRVRPFLKTNQRTLWREFINNTSVFTPLSIYRPNDPNFGIQTDLSMLVYAGIETRDAAAYISAMGLNHKKKRFKFGTLKKATAYVPGTKTAVYEIIYVEMMDPLEPNGKRLPTKLEQQSLQTNAITIDSSNSIWSRSISDLSADAPTAERPNPIITADGRGYEVSNPNVNEYYPNSISIWRERLKNWSDKDSQGNAISFESERNYLPLWMRSIQPGTKEELDFQLAVPVCYCKVGTADEILLNIKNYINTTDFSFNQLDYTADRYIIDSVEGLTADKYLVFRNDRITI